MTEITIPPEAVEAAARADYENWRNMYAVRGDTLEWEDIEPQLQDEHRSGVTAAIRAALAAWPGMEQDRRVRVRNDGTLGLDLSPRIILPLTENTPEKPDGSRVVHELISQDWDRGPYNVVAELKSLLTSVVDHGASIDSGTTAAAAYLYAQIGGVEYRITVVENRRINETGSNNG